MTYEEFLKAAGNYKATMTDPRHKPWSSRHDKVEQVESDIRVKWCTGGYTGGSCWDDSNPHPYTSDEREPEFEELTTILEKLVPNMTFLQYKRIIPKLIELDYETEHEYYGNSTDYSVKFVKLRKLYDALNEAGLL